MAPDSDNRHVVSFPREVRGDAFLRSWDRTPFLNLEYHECRRVLRPPAFSCTLDAGSLAYSVTGLEVSVAAVLLPGCDRFSAHR